MELEDRNSKLADQSQPIACALCRWCNEEMQMPHAGAVFTAAPLHRCTEPRLEEGLHEEVVVAVEGGEVRLQLAHVVRARDALLPELGEAVEHTHNWRAGRQVRQEGGREGGRRLGRNQEGIYD